MADNQILDSFKIKNELCPEIWGTEQDSLEKVLLPTEIRKAILSIAKLFIEDLNIKSVKIEDIVLLGSITGYNWSKYSDVDIHIIIDKNELSNNIDLVDEFFNAKKSIFSNKHDITIKGFDVELYVQDIDEENKSDGVYSVLYNKWLKTPNKPKNFSIDKTTILKKVKQYFNELKDIEDSDETDLSKLDQINRLKEKIKKIRKSGLESGGDLSTENLIFKYLRRNGFIERLIDLSNQYLDDHLTLDESEFY
jgi:predicted nucleotidyltransferase